MPELYLAELESYHLSQAAESYVNGKQLGEDVFTSAADAAVKDATPLTYGTGNAFRVELARGAVKKALRAVSQM